MREAETEFRLEMQTSLSLLQREIDVLEANKTRLEADLAGCAAAAAVAAKEQLEDELKRGFEAHVSSLQQKVKTLGAKLADTMTTADAALADSHSQAEENGSLKRAMSQKQTEIDAVKAQVIGLRAKLNKKEADLKEARGLATPSHKAMQAAYNQATGGECPPSPVLPCIDAAVQEEASPRQKRPLQASNISNAVPQEAGKGGPKAGVGGASGGSTITTVDGIDACISPLVEEIYAAADPNGTGILSFRDFARWASWDGQVLEWLDGATRAMGASLDAKDEGARARLGKVELGGLLKAYRAEGRSLDSPFGAGDLSSLLRNLLQSGEADADRIAGALHPLLTASASSLDSKLPPKQWLAVGTGTSLLCRGTQMEKLKAAFEMMDRAGTGRIGKGTMGQWLQGVRRYG